MLAFYKWVKLLLHRIDRNFYGEEIKTVLGDIIREKLQGLEQNLCFSMFLFSVTALDPPAVPSPTTFPTTTTTTTTASTTTATESFKTTFTLAPFVASSSSSSSSLDESFKTFEPFHSSTTSFPSRFTTSLPPFIEKPRTSFISKMVQPKTPIRMKRPEKLQFLLGNLDSAKSSTTQPLTEMSPTFASVTASENPVTVVPFSSEPLFASPLPTTSNDMTKQFFPENDDSLSFPNTEVSTDKVHFSMGQSTTEFNLPFSTSNPVSDDFLPEKFGSEQLSTFKPLADQFMPEQFVPDNNGFEQFQTRKPVIEQVMNSKFVSNESVTGKFVSEEFQPTKTVLQQFVPEKMVLENVQPNKPVSEPFMRETFVLTEFDTEKVANEQFQPHQPVFEQFMPDITISPHVMPEKLLFSKPASEQIVPALKFETEFSTDRNSMHFESSTPSPALNVLHAIHTLHGTDESEMHLGQNDPHVLQHEPVQELPATSMRIPGKQFQLSGICLLHLWFT